MPKKQPTTSVPDEKPPEHQPQTTRNPETGELEDGTKPASKPEKKENSDAD